MYKTSLLVIFIIVSSLSSLFAYPIDGFWYTGIRRLLYQESLVLDSTKQSTLKAGALLKMHEVELFLSDSESRKKISGFPEADPLFQKKVNNLFYGLNSNYSISVLDLSDENNFRYGGHRELSGYQPGSVGKLIVLTALFYELNQIYPNDWEKQREVLSNRFVVAGKWAMTDEHTIPIYDLNTKKLTKRTVVEKDIFSIYEWLDHMTSVSNNGAASVVYREAVLMHAFKDRYECLDQWESDKWFKDMKRDSLSNLGKYVMHKHIQELGISSDEWRLGQPFTNGASRIIAPNGGSIGTTKGLMKWLIALEKGEVVNQRSSLEMKRLIYMTDRRIRYGSSPKLNDAMVCFKSGSLYSCVPEAGYSCKKYAGNKFNYMNSVAIVEHTDCSKYLVVLMSNVLRKNSAGDHLGLASSIDKMVRTPN